MQRSAAPIAALQEAFNHPPATMMPGSALSRANTTRVSCRTPAALSTSALRPQTLRGSARRTPPVCRAEAEKSTEEGTSRAGESQGSLSEDEAQRLASLQRQQPERQREIASSTNILQGAFEEAQLISWPRPQKAFLDTILVLAIVLGSGGLLLGVNVLLANISEWWYHQG